MRTSTIADQMLPFLKRDETVIDIGAGSCQIDAEIKNRLSCQITPIDIVDYNRTDLKLIRYNGREIPFPDDFFDSGLLVFVLHHARNFQELFDEAKRVARSRIIVVEDTPRNFLERIAWRIWDYLLNLGHDLRPAMSAKSVRQWQEFFASNDMKIVEQQNFRTTWPVLMMYQHTLFVLEPK